MAEKGINGLIDLVAGSIGGCATVLVGQPLDTVKVKMQAFSHLYRNSFDCFRKTLLKDGIRRGLYAGTIPALYANVAENSVLFCAYGFCQNGVRYISPLSNTHKSPNRPLMPVENAFAGFFAAFFSSFTLCPTELVKCKLQALRETGKSVDISAFRLTKDIVKVEGFRGLFHGLVPTLAREMPGYFCFFGGYELSKSFLTNKKPNEAGLGVTILSGGVGGASLWIVIFPFDVVKSKIQIESLSNVSMIAIMRKIVKKEGIKGLYRGLFPTLLRTLPASGALFVAYEYSKFYMELGVREIGIL